MSIMKPCPKHPEKGIIDLAEGCPECIAERQAADAEVNSPDNIAKRIKEAEEAVAGKEVPLTIVKVRYIKRETGEAEGREYSYFTAEPLGLGFHVKAPVGESGHVEAVVTALDVPEAEVAAFRDRVKTIPAGSIMVRPAPDLFPELDQEPETTQAVTIVGKVEDTGSASQPPLVSTEEPVLAPSVQEEGIPIEAAAETISAESEPVQEGPAEKPAALVTIETQVGKPTTDLFVLYQEAAGLLQVAKKRVIATNEDLKPATDDLAIIATCKKAMFARKTEIVEPFKAKLDLVNQAFGDLMFPVLEADRLTRGQVTTFDNEQRRKAAEAKRIEDEKFKLAQEEAALSGTGEHTQELGTAQAPPPVPERTRTDLGTLGGRANWKARVVDFKLLPDEYKLPNEPMLNSFARSTKGERPIPGVEFYDDHVVTVRTK